MSHESKVDDWKYKRIGWFLSSFGNEFFTSLKKCIIHLSITHKHPCVSIYIYTHAHGVWVWVCNECWRPLNIGHKTFNVILNTLYQCDSFCDSPYCLSSSRPYSSVVSLSYNKNMYIGETCVIIGPFSSKLTFDVCSHFYVLSL